MQCALVETCVRTCEIGGGCAGKKLEGDTKFWRMNRWAAAKLGIDACT